MISLELAKRLRELGIEGRAECVSCHFGMGVKRFTAWPIEQEFYICPSLDQLLGEIEARGYKWSLKLLNRPQYRVVLSPDGLTLGGNGSSVFDADTPEEAAGRALLWILEAKE
jgi:hypothetical protein